jgi:hypothetical protein
MLILWRRHKAGCAADCRCRKKKRECHCCRCSIWADGYIGAPRFRQSLDTGDWAKAEQKRRKIEDEASRQDRGSPASPAEQEPVLIEAACEDFLSNARARGLKASTV